MEGERTKQMKPPKAGYYWIKYRQRILSSDPPDKESDWEIGYYNEEQDPGWWELIGTDGLNAKEVTQIGDEIIPPWPT